MSRWLVMILVPILLLRVSYGYKMLFLSPMPSKSHGILGDAIVKHLAEAGHEITYITAVIPNKILPGVKIIDASGNKILLDYASNFLNIKSVMDTQQTTKLANLFKMIPMMMNMSRNSVGCPEVQKLMSDKNQHFDVVILEWMFSEVYAGFATVFNCPLIWFSTMEPHWKVLQLIDERPNPAYSVDIRSINAPPLNFGQRVWELALQIFGQLFQEFFVSGYEKEIYDDLFVPHIRKRGLPVPALETLKYNASLILSNSHVSMGIVTRLPPNFIQIGGYHIDIAVEPLPQNLQKIMDDAKHGVIYFSMGSYLRSQHFPDEVKEDLLKVFGELKETVLWKFEEDLPNRPSNVHIVQWAPQQSILAHNNCKLFITHGGLLSTTETIHFGVPIVGIPVAADQFVNVARSVQKGFARKVDLNYEMAKELKIAIQEMLSNPKYTEKIKELSLIYHDRSVHPSKELVHWVEHVVKTRGALHLRSLALTMPWYQTMYLDLVLVLLSTVLVLKYLLRYTFGLINKKNILSSKKTN